jgi:hypothetical protein
MVHFQIAFLDSCSSIALKGYEGEKAMKSLYDELSEKLKKDPRLSKRGGLRADIGLLLLSKKDALRDLWIAAERYDRLHDTETSVTLHDAVEKLRPLFGERSDLPS